MSTILDAIQAKFNSAVAHCAAAELKVATERDTREGQVASLQDRVHALEVARDDVLTSLGQAHTAIETLQGRVDALVASLTQLGVDAGI